MMRRLSHTLAAALMVVAIPAGAARPLPAPPLLPPARTDTVIAPVAGPAQRLVAGAPADNGWWHTFANPTLDALVARALAANEDIATAEATLRQAREQARAVRGGLGPQVDLGYQGERQRVSKSLSGPLADDRDYLYSFHTAQLSVTYAPDVFGAGRNRVRSARAQADVAAQRLAAARGTVVADLVEAVIEQAGLREQLDTARAAVDSSRQLVALLQRRRLLGDIGDADVSAQQAALAAAEAVLPGLERQVAHQQAMVATLIGQPAGSAPIGLPTLDQLALPATLPLSLPARIVADRPDVRAAEAQLRGAAADLNVAIAERLPSISLSGTVGGSATRFTDMFAGGNPFWALIGAITAPIFHSGQLLHQKRAAQAALDAAGAQYRATALQAFLEVDDALNGLRTDAETLDAAARSDDAARRTLGYTRRQIELGSLGTLQLLNASITAAQASIVRVQARTARLSDSVLLYQAIGSVPLPPPGE